MRERFSMAKVLEFGKKKPPEEKKVDSGKQSEEKNESPEEKASKELGAFFAQVGGPIEQAAVAEKMDTKMRLDLIEEVVGELKNKKFSDGEIEFLSEPYQGFDMAKSFYEKAFKSLDVLDDIRGEEELGGGETVSDNVEHWKQILTIWKEGVDYKTSLVKNRRERQEKRSA